MPFVRISLPEYFSSETKENISKSIRYALMKTFSVPEGNYFHVIEELKEHQMKYPESYLGVLHTKEIIFVQITAALGRSIEQKKSLYSEVASKIAATTHITPNNIIIVLTENDRWQNWSFGNGEVQEPKHLKK